MAFHCRVDGFQVVTRGGGGAAGENNEHKKSGRPEAQQQQHGHAQNQTNPSWERYTSPRPSTSTPRPTMRLGVRPPTAQTTPRESVAGECVSDVEPHFHVTIELI